MQEVNKKLETSPTDLQTKNLEKKQRGPRQRKNSQMTTKSGGDNLLLKPRRNSKMQSSNITVKQTHGTHEKRNLKHNSSRENTQSSMSIDFERMDKQRDDYSEFSKMMSAGSNISRIEDQRRRLESFLSLA